MRPEQHAQSSHSPPSRVPYLVAAVLIAPFALAAHHAAGAPLRPFAIAAVVLG